MNPDYGTFVTAAALAHAGDGADADRVARFGFLGLYVYAEDIEYLDQHIVTLKTDVREADSGPAPNPVTEPQQFARWMELDRWMSQFKWQYSQFYVQWAEWVQDHAAHPSRLGEDVVIAFNLFRTRYNEFLRVWNQKLPGTTAAKKAGKEPEGTKPPWGDVPSAIKWTAAAVIAVTAAYALSKAA